MSGRFSKLRFWSKKSTCEMCEGQPTPPPCYNCILKLETPPPSFTSVQGHFFHEDDPSSLYTHDEEYAYPEDAGIRRDFDQENQEERKSLFGFDAYSPYAPTDASDVDIYNLPRAVGSIAMAFLPNDQRRQHQQLLDVNSHERTRHPSAPVFSNGANHGAIARRSSISQLDNQDIINIEDDGQTMTGSNRSLLDVLSVPLSQWNDQLQCSPYDEPQSPRGASPLPSQLFIPE